MWPHSRGSPPVSARTKRRVSRKAEGLNGTQAGGGVRSTKPLLYESHVFKCRRPDRILSPLL